MKTFGLDLGGNQIKIAYWNGDQQSSKGVGPEMVENNNGKLSSSYLSSIQNNLIALLWASKTCFLTFATNARKMYKTVFLFN